MRAPELKTVAVGLATAGAPGLPTVVLTREVPLFEVELAALEFAEEAALPASDWATLALTRALGEMTPADLDGYLGLGEAVSEGLVRRLVDDGLLEERLDEKAVTLPPPAEPSGIAGFFRRLFGASAPPAARAAPEPRIATAARKVRESRASTSPTCRLSTAGSRALERGAVARRRVRPARLLFLAEPLLFLGVMDEKRQRYTQHRRAVPLEPEDVPEALRVLDATFALTPAERLAACGIEKGIRGFSGQLVGIVPGAQWEVRHLERRGNKGREHQMGVLVLAAFPSSDADGLTWRAYLRQQDQTLDCPHVDTARLLRTELRSVRSLLTTIEADVTLPAPDALRTDGAFELRCDSEALLGLLGESDRPDDTFVPASTEGWWVGLRAHARPLDIEAGRAAFYEFLLRREAALRRDFDGTCADVATSLSSYWGESHGLASADEAATHLWARAELRAALCMRRRHRDLVAPYADDGAR